MAVTRPSAPLKNKTNVNPVVNRPTEATAEDFQEVGALLDEYADALDLLLGSNYRADFLGYFGSKALLEATFPAPPENSFGIIVDQANNPVEIWKYTAGAYVLVQGSDNIKFYNSRNSFPATAEVGILYIAKDSRQIYGWWNSRYYNLSLNEEENQKIAYTQLTYKETADFPTYTMTNEFELVRENLDGVYFLVRDDVNIDFANCRVKLLENNKATDLTSPDIEQSNYKAYLVNLELYSSILVDGDTYHFTFWRKVLPENITSLSIQDKNAIEQFKLTDTLKLDGFLFDDVEKKVSRDPHQYLVDYKGDAPFITNPTGTYLRVTSNYAVIPLPFEAGDTDFLYMSVFIGGETLKIIAGFTNSFGISGFSNATLYSGDNTFDVSVHFLNDGTNRLIAIEGVTQKEFKILDVGYSSDFNKESLLSSLQNISETNDISSYNIDYSVISTNYLNKLDIKYFPSLSINANEWVTIAEFTGFGSSYNIASGRLYLTSGRGNAIIDFEVYENPSLSNLTIIENRGVYNHIKGVRITTNRKLQVYFDITFQGFQYKIKELNSSNIVITPKNETAEVTDVSAFEIILDIYSNLHQNVFGRYITSPNIKLTDLPKEPDGLIPGQLFNWKNKVEIFDVETLPLGLELNPDTGFNDNTLWTLSADTTIVAGVLTVADNHINASTFATIPSNETIKAGKYYLVSVDFISGIRPAYRIGGKSQINYSNYNQVDDTNETNYFILKANSDSSVIEIVDGLSSTTGCEIDYLSVKEIKLNTINPETLDLSELGSYADDTAAAAGGVEIGEGYINSSTGVLQRRLT